MEIVPLDPDGRRLVAPERGADLVLHCPASSGQRAVIGRLSAGADQPSSIRVACTGTRDDVDCLFATEGEPQRTRISCYPARATPIVAVDSLEQEPNGTARLQLIRDASRPGNEQLKFEGGLHDIHSREARTPSGALVRSVFERDVPASTTALTTLYVGRSKVLLALRPAARFVIRYDGCASWAFDAGWPKEGKAGHFRVRGAASTPFTIEHADAGRQTREAVTPAGVSPYYPAGYKPCDRIAIATRSDRAFLVIGGGERWTINIRADGRILGGVQEPPDPEVDESSRR
jgi:hypothetical protein